MELYLVRHAIAEPRGGPGPDANRALTPKGSSRFRREVRGLERLGVGFDRIVHSPWRRAAETAELLAPLLDGERVSSPLLARGPGDSLLELFGEAKSVALVGHQPWLTELAAWLSFGRKDLGASLDLKKGGVLVLSGDPRPSGMVVEASLPPKVLRALAK